MRTLIDGTPARQAAPSLVALRARRAEVLEVCARHGASNVSVFGSVARGEQDGESDLDLVVDIEDGRSLFDLAGLIDDLEDLLGCPVNVVEHCMLKDDTFGRAVRHDAVPL
ncbi:MAG: nucleotidyltransferase family protein [Acidobacteriota bacterium]|nr:nucleotidyltransferase family protein [Acidobacteriota bacterium]